MTPQRVFGDSHPNAILNSEIVRQIRLLHFCDGVSVSQIANDLKMHNSSVSRILNWLAWTHQDYDLRGLPKPRRKDGHHVKLERPEPKPTCRDCLHLNQRGNCGFGFPECHTSAFKEAAQCNAFIHD